MNAAITITPSATNEVGQPHTFTVTLHEGHRHRHARAGRGRARRRHADAVERRHADAPAGHVHRCTTDAIRPVHDHVHLGDGRQGDGARAATLTVDGVPMPVATDGAGGDSGDATKTFVDANIQITPAQRRQPGRHAPHAHRAREREHGQRLRFVQRAGRHDDHLLDRQRARAASSAEPAPATTTGGTGSCTVQITSTTTRHDDRAGLDDGDGRRRDAAPARPATPTPATAPMRQKTWVDATITITPTATNEVGAAAHLHGDPARGHGRGHARPGRRAARRRDAHRRERRGPSRRRPARCTTAGANTDANGQCTITFSSPSAGTVTGHATATLDRQRRHDRPCRPTAIAPDTAATR